MRIRSLHIIRVFIKHHGREKYVHVNRNLTTVGSSQPSLNNRETLRKILFNMTVGKAVFNSTARSILVLEIQKYI